MSAEATYEVEIGGVKYTVSYAIPPEAQERMQRLAEDGETIELPVVSWTEP